MELTVGTTLQGNKYVVQEILNQTEQEITCKATHTYLDQAVVLQTFNPSLQQQDTFAHLKQQFIAGVRSIAKQTARPPLQVLDYFEENGLPFVVLPLSPALPKLNDWLSSSSPTAPTAPTSLTAIPAVPDAVAQSAEIGSTLPSSSSTIVPPVVESKPVSTTSAAVSDRPVATVAAQSSATTPSLNQPTRSRTYEPIIFRPTSRSNAATPAIDAGDKAAPLRSSQNRPKNKFPVMLMVIAVTSGLVGVGTGLALRFAPSPQQNGAKPRLSFFQRQQTFPPEGTWPVRQRPIYTPPEPTIEQPLYRAAPPSDYSDPTLLPSPSFDAPAPDPALEEPPPLPEYTPPAEDLEAPLKAEPKLPLELAPLPEVNPDVPAYTLPPESPDAPPLITEPPAPILPEPNSVNPAPKPLLGNSSRIVTQ
jgi:hypothetical protein